MGGFFMRKSTRRLVESAVMLAIGTVLSLFTFAGPWALGGGITICSMLPLVIIAHRHGTGWGLFTAFAYGVLQMLLGMNNVQYATSFLMAVGIIVFDYLLPFTLVGLSAAFSRRKTTVLTIILGIVFTFALRFACHFVSGWIIWEALWPNELGWAPAIWSLAYNASYMLPEMGITAAVAAVSFASLKKFWLGRT